MFGNSFGSRNTSGFGQTSTFGKPSTSFTSPGFGSTNTSLFGQSSQPTTSLFGSTASTFGQTTTTQSFGNFGSGSNTSLFGTQQTTASNTGGLFGNQNSGGNTAGGSLFGSPASNTFGSSTGFGSFGTSNNSGSLFGQPQQNAVQSTSLFGPTNSTGAGLFGSSTSAFSSAGNTNGTTIKFNPVTGADTVMKNGITQTISTKHHCITCMKEYESKSLEELRYEDYLANRKGPVQGTQTGGALFGGTAQSNLFGNNTNAANTSGGSLFGNSGFGQPSVFGQSGLQSNNSLFGKPASSPFGTTTTTTQSSGFGSFGQTSNLFGSNTNQPKSTFGSSQPSSGLFGSNIAPGNNFGTQSSNFGFGTQQQNQGIGLFGQQNKFIGFGVQTTSNFTFGSNTSAANTTSLFNQKPTTTGFGIASTSAGNTFGSTPFSSNTSGSNNLFSGNFNKPQNSGFSFGQNASTTSVLGGSNPNSGSLLFGSNVAKPTNFFSNANSSSGLIGTGFGSAGGFGSTSATNFNGLNLGNNSFGNNLNASQNTHGSNVCDQIQVLSVIPYGNSSLYKHLKFSNFKNENILKQSVVPQKPSSENNGYKISTQINNIVVRKAHSILEFSKKSLFDKIGEEFNEKTLNQQRSSPRYLKLKPKAILNKSKLVEKDNNSGSGSGAPDSSINSNKENIDFCSTSRVNNHSVQEDTNSFSILGINESESSVNNDDTMLEFGTKDIRHQNKDSVNYPKSDVDRGSFNSNGDEYLIETTENISENENRKSSQSHSSNIKLTRPDYFTVPSLHDLDEMMNEEGQCIIKNFTVGRHKYGNVTFYEAFDVAGLDLDSIVFFRHKEIEIYPNDEFKPPVGVGLNRRAQVTLDRVWPIDKSTREIINNPERLKQLNFVAKLKRSSIKMNAQFIEYRPLTGSWVFEVEHFSKYGLDESDEESLGNNEDKFEKDVTSNVSDRIIDFKNTVSNKELFIKKKRGLDGRLISNEIEVPIEQYNIAENDETMAIAEEHFALDFRPNDFESITTYEEFCSPAEKLARNLDTSLHKVQLMKASFYITDEISDSEISLNKGIPDLDLFATGRIDAYRSTAPGKNLLPLMRVQYTSQFPPPVDIPIADFSNEEYKPPIFSPETKLAPVVSNIVSQSFRVSPKFKKVTFPFYKSIMQYVNMSLCDSGLYFGQHFRIGWSHGLKLVCLSSAFRSTAIIENETDDLLNVFSEKKVNDFSSSSVSIIQLKTLPSEDLQENLESHLDVCLKESTFFFEESLPFLTPKSGTESLHEHCDIEQRTFRIDQDYTRQVWELMVALWGNLPYLNSDTPQNSHKNGMLRKAALSDWLKNVVSSTTEKETNEHDFVFEILSLLSCRKIYEACECATLNGDHNLALLISQIGSSEITRSLMEQQLKQWHESEADQLIDVGRLKIMTLIAGHMLYISSKNIINTCENLDWKKAFALHLWYITKPSDLLIEALLQYEKTYKFEDKFASAPNPFYEKNDFELESCIGRKAEDLCFHLLKLYSRRSYPLELVLNPVTYSKNVLDYCLSWFVMVTLESLGYSHLSEESKYIIHASFAAQLEMSKLWHWSIFVLLHITDFEYRSSCVKNIINKNVELFSDNVIDLSKKEKFIYEKLKVPAELIYHSKGMLAESLRRYKEAAWYYIKAKRWNEAHEIIINHLVVNAVINENYKMISDLINEIAASERIICGWNYKGAIISNYLAIMNRVNLVIEKERVNSVSFLESIQSLLNSVCTKIKYYPTRTTRERLCQAEISKRIIQIIRTVLHLQCGKYGIPIRSIVSLIDQLPLPEDYKQQELQEIISWWINK